MLDVLIQTFNEEQNLPSTLASISGWVNRIVVVDSGSTDDTVKVAEGYGAQVVHHAWEGYARQKNWALQTLDFQSNWVLILDADEAVSPELKEEILSVVSRPVDEVEEAGFLINRVFIFMGREIRHCGYFPSWNLRLFKRGMARYEDRSVHEHMICDGPVGRLRHLLIHEDRRGLEHFFAKHNRYSTLEAREMFENPEPWPGVPGFLNDQVRRRRFLKSRVLPRVPVPWIWRFLFMYVIRLGFLDGRAGWLLSNFISTYEFSIHVKYRELARRRVVTQLHPSLADPEGSIHSESELHARRPHDVASKAPPRAPQRLSRAQGPAFVVPGTNCTGEAPRARRRPQIDVIILTRDEASQVEEVVRNAAQLGVVTVVDSHSIDGTAAIAEAAGAQVLCNQFENYAQQRNWALEQSHLEGDWVLMLDADERIPAALRAEITAAVERTDVDGFRINRSLIFMGRQVRHGGLYPAWSLRLFRRGTAYCNALAVDEEMICRGKTDSLRHEMLHVWSDPLHELVAKHIRFADLRSDQWLEWREQALRQRRELSAGGPPGQNTPASPVHLLMSRSPVFRRALLKWTWPYTIFRSLGRFMYMYILRGGFLDGRAGWTLASLVGSYEYMTGLMYREKMLHRAPPSPNPVICESGQEGHCALTTGAPGQL